MMRRPEGYGGTSERKESDAKQNAALCSVCQPRGDDAGRGDLRRDGLVGPEAGRQAASKHALKGGTLRVNASNNDFEFSDPGLAYDTLSWSMLYTTQMLLVNFPEKNGQAGSVLYPEAATSFPTVSKNGLVYVFHIRPGLKFSDGSAVTAAAYQRAWERNLSPKMGSPVGVNDQFQSVVVGAQAFLDGKAQSISGIKASGLTLTFKLTKANPTFTSYLGMQWFGAVKPDMPYTTSGVTGSYPSAGPYFIQSRDVGRSLVEARNPYYKGSRPANADKIVWTMNTDQDQSLLQVKAGQADVDAGAPPPTANASLAQQYGVNKSRFFVGGTSCVLYWAMNTSRAPFNTLAARKAINWALDRPAMVRLFGFLGAKRSDQILVPGVPGYKPYNLYAFRGANPTLAKKIDPSLAGKTAVIFHSTSSTAVNIAQIAAFNLSKIGMSTKDRPVPGSVYYKTLGTKGVDYDLARAGWCADYFDPFDYVNVNLDGRSIQDQNNVNFAYMNSASMDKLMDAAANQTGAARSKAYQKLDYTIMKNYAPWVPYSIINGVFFVSSRTHNYVYSSYFGEPDFNALSVG
jgi:peptide/nickel transport system substrate-binding protein